MDPKPVTPLADKPQYSNSRPVSPASEEKELWHRIVVKIIRWKTVFKKGDDVVDYPEKITMKEWKTYCRRKIRINTSFDKVSMLNTLKEIQRAITTNGGFK